MLCIFNVSSFTFFVILLVRSMKIELVLWKKEKQMKIIIQIKISFYFSLTWAYILSKQLQWILKLNNFIQWGFSSIFLFLIKAHVNDTKWINIVWLEITVMRLRFICGNFSSITNLFLHSFLLKRLPWTKLHFIFPSEFDCRRRMYALKKSKVEWIDESEREKEWNEMANSKSATDEEMIYFVEIIERKSMSMQFMLTIWQVIVNYW